MNGMMTLNLAKCEWEQREITFSGYPNSAASIRPDQSKAEVLTKMSKGPLKPKDVRSYLGVCNYFIKHIPNYTYLTSVLT